MTRSFGIVRTPEGLFRLSIRITEDALLDFGRLKSTAQFADVTPGFILETSPVLPPHSTAEKSAVQAWNSLESFRGLNGQTEKAIATVLTKTVAGDDRPQAPAHRPCFHMLPARPPRTQAHPRGYRGTTNKPPKAKSLRAIDLRPHLCDPETIEPLLQQHASVTIRNAWNPQETELAPLFRATLLPAVRNLPWSEIKCAHGIFHRLRLAEDPDLLSSIVTMFVRSAMQAFLWCELIAETMPDRRTGFAQLILITRVMGTDIAPIMPTLAEQVREVIAGPEPVYRMACLLRGLRFGVDGGYMLAGFRLADRFSSRRREPHAITHHGYFPEDTVEQIIHATSRDDGFEEWMIVDLWAICGKLEGFGEFIAQRSWNRYAPAVSRALLELYICRSHEDDLKCRNIKWAVLREGIGEIESSLDTIEAEYQWKFIVSLKDMFSSLETSQMRRDTVELACTLLEKMCTPPYHPRRRAAFVWSDLITYLRRKQMTALLCDPGPWMLPMEKACRTGNLESRIGRGVWAVAQIATDFTFTCLQHAPARFFQTAKVIGCLPPEVRLQLITAFRKRPEMQRDISALPDRDAFDFIAAHTSETRKDAIPPSLRTHYEGGPMLSSPRLTHYTQEMRKGWLRTCLQILEELATASLGMGLPELDRDGNILHALQIERGTLENRRALRKFLTAYWSGKTNYILSHSLTQAWLRKHPGLDVSLWTTGITLQFELAQDGPITIVLERDPLEALKLGTHVGSCLGLGGILEYSAAANVLDINKQVLYARNARGAVIGRQIVAYSEAGEIVCFWVYPISASAALKHCFAEYDRQFAAALGVPIFAPSTDADTEEAKYEVTEILSHNWWDDTAWDLKIEDAD